MSSPRSGLGAGILGYLLSSEEARGVVGLDSHASPWAPALCSPRADNWLVDTGEDKAQSQGLSSFGQVSGGRGNDEPWAMMSPRRSCEQVGTVQPAWSRGVVCDPLGWTGPLIPSPLRAS